MSTPAACLLLSEFVPAAARLFAEFRRLRDRLPPAEARKLALFEKHKLRHAALMDLVRMPRLQSWWPTFAAPNLVAPPLRGCARPDAWLCENVVQRSVQQAASKRALASSRPF